MVPAAIVFLDRLPVTPNGKVDRRALPAPDGATRPPEPSFVAPRTEVERTLAAIWADVLGVERVGIHDDFFALGGHSLLATRVASRVREAFGVDLPLRDFLEAVSVARVADVVEAARAAGTVRRMPPIRPLRREEHRVDASAFSTPGTAGAGKAGERP
jgi:acyl carrier protein